MKTFFLLWEITFPLVIIAILFYIVFLRHMYDYLANGNFRKNFIHGDIIMKLIHIVMFILYLPIYIILIIIGVYR